MGVTKKLVFVEHIGGKTAQCTVFAYYRCAEKSLQFNPLFDWEFELHLSKEQQEAGSDFSSHIELKSLGSSIFSGQTVLRDWNVIPGTAIYLGSGPLKIYGRDMKTFFPECCEFDIAKAAANC